MSNYPGFYYYQKPVSCSACMDSSDLFGDIPPDCKKCYEANKIKVELLQFSGRLFRHEAIVKDISTGKIFAVPIRCLTYGGQSDGL